MKIAVLMSTYNGEKYLQAQIESILSQKLKEDWELTLWVRDDGSVDQTSQIIDDFAGRYENVIRISTAYELHLGLKDSFLLALKTAMEQEGGYDYYAFSDQDDVWLPDKLTAAIDRLKNSGNPKGALYYSNKWITDAELHIEKKEHIGYYGDFPELLHRSLAYGNTMVFNDCLAGYVNRHDPATFSFHDAWSYRLAKCIGSDVFFDQNAYILYRQHAGNDVGYAKGTHKSWPSMILNFIPKLIKPRDHATQNQVKEIDRFYQKDLDPKVLNLVQAVMDYNQNFKDKWMLLTDPDMKKRPVLDRLIWIYKILFNMF